MPTYSNEWDPGDARANNEHRNRMGFGGTEHGGVQYAQRSRMLGDEAQKRGAYQSDFGQSNESRGLGMNSRGAQGRAMDLAESAARGNQPSAAEIMSRRNTSAAVNAGRSLAGGIKGGPGARVAAMRNAQRMGAQQMADGAARTEELRANEMDRARGQFIGASTAMRQGDTAQRGQDLDATRIQQTNELTQRGLNDTQQRFFEQQGFNTQVQDQNNQLAQQAMANQAWAAGRGAEGEDEKFEFGKVMEFAKTAAGTAAGMAGGAATAMSDEAAKDLMPMGSLGGLSYGGTTGGSTNAMSGGGMNAMAGQQWNNSQIRGMSGPSIMRSDMAGKNGVMFSPGEIKDPVSAPAFIAAEGERRQDADPYMRVADTGVAGAPRGYAAARAGHAGSMFSEAPAVASGYEKQAAQTGAPGTDDWNKYGAPGAKDGPVDWKHGGTTTEAGKKPNAVMGSLAGMLRGFAAPTSTSDVRSKDGVMFSDDKTKLAAAWDEGHRAALQDVSKRGGTEAAKAVQIDRATSEQMRVNAKRDGKKGGDSAMVRDAVAESMAKRNALVDSRPVSGGEVGHAAKPVSRDRPGSEVQPLTEEERRQQPWYRGAPPSAPQQAAPPEEDGVLASVGRFFKSDEKAKNVIDLKDDVTRTDPKDEKSFQAWKKKYAHPQDDGEDYDLRGAWKAGLKPGPDGHWPDTFKRPNHPTFSNESKYAGNEGAKPGRWEGDTFIPYAEPGSDASRMRDGSSDPRTNSFDKTFRRDTKADQKAVKKGVQDKAGKDADAMMAGMQASLGKGPSARVEDVDSDEKPDLRNAASEAGKAGHIPEHAMFRAMKAMEPSLYAYKPEFKPPEQAPGEVQAGPMANNMERDPIAGTAIVREPKTGLLAIDKDKALKLTMGSLAVLANDVEQMKRKKGARK
jgi:hypothetical protein